MKMKYNVENGFLNITIGTYEIYLNHPVIIIGAKHNEFEEVEKRFKISLGTGIHYNSNDYLEYFYLGVMLFGLGFGISRQTMGLNK